MRYLLDTNVISELIKKQPHPSVLRWIDERDESALYLSVITLGELQKGINKLIERCQAHVYNPWDDVYNDL